MDLPLETHAAGHAHQAARHAPWRMELAAGLLAFTLALTSMLLFMMNTVADRVGVLIEQQNAAALQLSDNLDYFRIHRPADDASMPPGLFSSVVEFSRNTAIVMQEIHRLSLLNFIGLGGPVGNSGWTDTLLLRLKPKDGNATRTFDHTGVDPATDGKTIAKEGDYQIELYQAIRDYSQEQCTSHKDEGGAFSIYVLPILYALLGAGLCSLRRSQHGKPMPANNRYAIAIIAGAVIGTFGAMIPTSLSLSPLAIAFLLGYSVDAFTAWLDRLIDKLKNAAG